MRLKLDARSLLFLALLAPPLLGAALGMREASARNDELYGPAQAVARYFDAISREDCTALEQSVAGTLEKELSRVGCGPTFARMRSHRLQYIASGPPRADGRDAQARLVPIRVRFNEAEKELVVRVSRRSSWKLATF